MHKELMAQENAILSENTALWEKVFMEADKGMAMQLRTAKTTASSCWIPSRVPRISLRRASGGCSAGEAKKIRDIENTLTMLEEKYPEVAQISMDGDMSMPAGRRHEHGAR